MSFSVNDFLASPDKMDILMHLVCVCKTIGETVKNIDNLTNHELLINYAGTPWSGASLNAQYYFSCIIYLFDPLKFLK